MTDTPRKERHIVISLQGTPEEKDAKASAILALVEKFDSAAKVEVAGGKLRAVFLSTSSRELIAALENEQYPMRVMKDAGCLNLCKAGYTPNTKKS